jgi:Cof subfamily protein (haloacid dehalogenase superfamily)
MYRLLAVDLDGTLLNSVKKISEENKKAIRRVIEKGVKVVICSGRVYKGARVFARDLNLDGLLISCNGAVIKDLRTDELLYSNLLRKEDCYKVIDCCRKENTYFHAYIGNDMFTEYPQCPSDTYWMGNNELPEKDRVKINIIDDFKRIVSESQTPVTKIVVISKNPELLLKLRNKVCRISTIDVMSSQDDNFEIVNKGVNKGTALKFLSEKLKIPRTEIVAIGDNENDYAMLKFAGLSIAMRNAQDSIKEIADYITMSNDENGVAEAINKVII